MSHHKINQTVQIDQNDSKAEHKADINSIYRLRLYYIINIFDNIIYIPFYIYSNTI